LVDPAIEDIAALSFYDLQERVFIIINLTKYLYIGMNYLFRKMEV